jgi:hypothetical protein
MKEAALISETEIETYAVQIASPDFKISDASFHALVGHLDKASIEAVMLRYAEIIRERGEALLAESDAITNLLRAAYATGMPEGGQPIPWLQERGLVEEVDGGWLLKKPGPKAASAE